MGTFTIKKQDGHLFTCRRCKGTTYNTFVMKNSEPVIMRKSQVLMVIIKCESCGESNMIYHTKIRAIKLIDMDTLEVL